jgi:hypothetical protein
MPKAAAAAKADDDHCLDLWSCDPVYQPSLLERCVRVVVERPGAADLGIQSHINRAAVGWNARYRLRKCVQRGARVVDVCTSRRTTKCQTVSRSTACGPLKGNSRPGKL